jgi:hypothetical protein
MYPLEYAFDYGNQFLGLERFYDVCVHAAAKSSDAISRLILGGEENDGNKPGAR